jgi:aminoglycoside phosphotransferase (APT) family kinase protein
MEVAELARRLVPFLQAMYEDPAARTSDVYRMPGHAGFSYGFTATSGGRSESWYLRLPPPNVKWRGTADMLRQVEVLRALDGTDVPHCSVRWAGDDLQWFGRPYFVVPKLEGSARVPYLGDPIPFDEDVRRWDRLRERAANPELLARAPEARERLLERLPDDAPIGVFHGDFQWSNLFYSGAGELLAVIDWELVGVGATLNDVGWIATFNDPGAWAHAGAVSGQMPGADELVAMYVEAWRQPLPDLSWYRALAAYKFAVITGFNLGLHRRGKRPDPLWEAIAPSARSLIDRALERLD